MYQSRIWKDRKCIAEGMMDIGAAVYAARKDALWMHMAITAADSKVLIHLTNQLYNSSAILCNQDLLVFFFALIGSSPNFTFLKKTSWKK